MLKLYQYSIERYSAAGRQSRATAGSPVDTGRRYRGWMQADDASGAGLPGTTVPATTGPRPLQNRVAPTGELIATVHRGTFLGNRGILHDRNRAIVRYSQHRRWLVCTLEFRGRRRQIMAPGRYTELFFLDEAVALAAGHRPCAECRRDAYQAFRSAWQEAQGLPSALSADETDWALHAERSRPRGRRSLPDRRLADLPDGVFVRWQGEPWLVRGQLLLRWSPAGYTGAVPRSDGLVPVITPPSTIAAIGAGYRPAIHPSADPLT
jgi:hypothetical protein